MQKQTNNNNNNNNHHSLESAVHVLVYKGLLLNKRNIKTKHDYCTHEKY